MKILHVTPYFAPAWGYGGPPRSIYELSRELTRRGHKVSVATTDALTNHERIRIKRENLDGIDVRRFRNVSNRLAWKDHLFLPLGFAAFLRRCVPDFDVIHIHMYRNLQNILVRRYAIRYGVPFVFSARGALPRIVRRYGAKLLFDVAFGHRFLRDASCLVASSHVERRQYEAIGLPSWKISVVHNGIDVAPYRNLPTPGKFAAAHGLTSRRIVTYMGRLNERKGLDHLLHAFRGLCPAQNVTLVLAGPDDGYRAHLEQLAKSLDIARHVVFTGLVTGADRLRTFVDSDVVVYPTEHEPFGLVPFEALACGRPVVCSRKSGCGELLESVRGGFTVPFGDVAALRTAIQEALKGGSEVKARTKRGQRLVFERLNWDRIGSEMEQVYHDALAFAERSRPKVPSAALRGPL